VAKVINSIHHVGFWTVAVFDDKYVVEVIIGVFSAIIAMIGRGMEKLQKSGHQQSLIKENIHNFIEVFHPKESFCHIS